MDRCRWAASLDTLKLKELTHSADLRCFTRHRLRDRGLVLGGGRDVEDHEQWCVMLPIGAALGRRLQQLQRAGSILRQSLQAAALTSLRLALDQSRDVFGALDLLTAIPTPLVRDEDGRAVFDADKLSYSRMRGTPR